MHRYVIKAIGYSKWADHHSCELGISIGNPCHEGDKFYSIMQWADKRFRRCIVTLSDTLNRYTLMCDGTDEAAAYFQAKKRGDLWLEQNRHALKSAVNTEVILKRWDEWLNHPDYQKIYDELARFRDTDDGLQQAFRADATNYLARRSTRGEDFNYDRAFQNSMNFFVEEIACYILIGRTYGALRAYSARDMHCFAYMRGPNIPESLRGLERAPHVELGFKRKLKAGNDADRQAA